MIKLTDKAPARPVYFLAIVLACIFVVDAGLFVFSWQGKVQQRENGHLYDIATSGIGLTDLCVSTEARYTRHPAVSDPVVPFMDHPGAIEHFPSGSFWAPPGIGVHNP